MRGEACVDCGAPLPDTGDCWTRVRELLEVETRVLPRLDPERGRRAHFFAIAAYQLQHPFRASADALAVLRSGIGEMLDDGARPIEMLRRDMAGGVGRGTVRRDAMPGDRAHVDPTWPREWPITAVTVLGLPDSRYEDAVAAWARTTMQALAAVRS